MKGSATLPRLHEDNRQDLYREAVDGSNGVANGEKREDRLAILGLVHLGQCPRSYLRVGEILENGPVRLW